MIITWSTSPVFRPAEPLASRLNSHFTMCVPGPMTKLFLCQPPRPLRVALSVLSTKNFSWTPASEEVSHQKEIRAGPFTVVFSQLVWLFERMSGRAASTPSWLTEVWPIQGREPPVCQARVRSRTAERVNKG